MKAPVRIAAWVVLLPLALGLLLLVASALLSPRRAGQALAAAVGIPHPAVIAHRGLSYWAPEETRAAYELARDVGADYLEVDVQRTSDGVLIAFHDDTLARTTNVAAVFPDRRERGPEAFTYAELASLDAGSWFNRAHPERARPAYVGARILRLQELLEIASPGPHRPGLYIETKGAQKYQGYEREIVQLLTTHGFLSDSSGPARVIFQSFVVESLEQLRTLAPSVPRVLLLEHEWPAGTKAPSWAAQLAQAKAVGCGVGPSGYEGFPWHTGPVHRAGLLAHHYTINEPWQIRLLLQFGSDGLFTDAADRVLVILGRGPVDVPGAMQRLGL